MCTSIVVGNYFETLDFAMKREGHVVPMLVVLARDAGIRGIFSDGPGTATYYASCLGLN